MNLLCGMRVLRERGREFDHYCHMASVVSAYRLKQANKLSAVELCTRNGNAGMGIS